MPLARPPEFFRAAARAASYDPSIVGIADASLDVLFAHGALVHELERTDGLDGASLLDIVDDTKAVRALAMLLAGVVRKAVVTKLTRDRCLVAQLARIGGATDDAEKLVVLRIEPCVAQGVSPLRAPFVGRAHELHALDTFVIDDASSRLVVEGPLGIGKTALLRAYEARCRAASAACFWIDARRVAPNGAAILTALYPAHEASSAPLSMTAAHAPLASLASLAREVAGRRWILLVDNFDAWTRGDGFPSDLFTHLPDNVRIVAATRRRPSPRAWGDTAREIALLTLGALSDGETRALARELDVDVDARGIALRRAHGHPLSIVQLARPLSSTADREAHALDAIAPDASDANPRLSRDVLKVVALPVRITEDIVAALLDDDAGAAATYDALSEICMRDPDNVGLRMPEAIREVLGERLRRRNPLRFAALHLKLAQYYAKRVDDRSAVYAPTVVDDLLDTLAEHPVIRRMMGPREGELTVRRAHIQDAEAVASVARRLSDVPTAEYLASRIDSASSTTYVLERDGEIAGVAQFAIVAPASEGAPEPSCRRRAVVQASTARMGIKAQPAAALLAYAIDDQDVASWGEVSQAVTRLGLRILFTSDALGAFVVISDPLRPGRRLPGEVFVTLDGFRLAIRDLRGATSLAMVTGLLAMTDEALSIVADGTSPRLALTTESVRLAFASFDRLDLLATSPLAALDMCRGSDPAAQLQRELRAALARLRESRADGRHADILEAVYVEKRGKHEQIARELGIPYGTFRRQVTRALDAVRGLLTQRVSSAGEIPITA